jgi:hypothetical protein
VILLSLTLAAGCSSDPRVEANDAVERANKNISAHDGLFDEARKAYSQSQQAVQNSNESNESTESGSPGAQDVSRARNKLQDARGRLEEARMEISGIQDLDVSDDLTRYSRTLEDALAAQMRGEKREISFYGILADDPGLEKDADRREAMNLLDEASQAYKEAENGYQKAADTADSNPNFAASESGG